MASNVIKEWLIDYKALPESQLNTYAATVRRNVELTTALYQLLEEDLVQEVLDPVCHQLFDFYRSPLAELRRFTLELVPALITAYLFAVARNEKKKCGGIEVLLLGIYNLEIVDTSGKSRVRTYTIPSLASPSIYHEPPSLATLALTESSLMRYHNDEPITLTVGPMSHVESINAQNRLSVLTYIMSMYNMEIGELGPNSHFSVCTMCSRLCKNGFDSLADDMLSTSQGAGSRRQSRRSSVSFRQDPRIPLASNFLVECLNGLYYAIFNGQAREGLLALDLIHMRASYELYPDVLLVTNAIRNSLAYNPSGQPEDGPMGISIALSPNQTHNPSFLKDAITNASFRTKRMPEDIGPESDEETEHETSTEHDANKSPNRKLSVGKKEKRKNSDVHSPSAMDNLRTRFRIRRSSSISVPHKGMLLDHMFHRILICFACSLFCFLMQTIVSGKHKSNR